MAYKTELMVSLTLYFDSDFDVYTISEITNLRCDDCKKLDETKYNIITLAQNSAYWKITTGYIQTLDYETLELDFINRIGDSYLKIKSIIEENQGFASLSVVAKIKKHTPSLNISREMMRIALFLNTDIDIDLYVD